MDHAFLAKHSLEIFAQFIGVTQLLIGLLLLSVRFFAAGRGAARTHVAEYHFPDLVAALDWHALSHHRFLVLNIGLYFTTTRAKVAALPACQCRGLRLSACKRRHYHRSTLVAWHLPWVIIGGLLYRISLRTMTSTMLLGAALLVGATVWHHFLKRQQSMQKPLMAQP
jgi:hypothetical protein